MLKPSLISILCAGTAGLVVQATMAQQVGFHVVPIYEGFNDSRVRALSYDGSVAVGIYGDNASQAYAYRWSPSTDLQLIPTPLDARGSAAQGVSRDGGSIVGSYSDSGSNQRGFITTSDGFSTDLGTASVPFYSRTKAMGISDNGSIVCGTVGTASDMGVFDPMIWTASGGIRVLGSGTHSEALAVSNDGRVAVGTGYTGGFVWTEETGMQIPMRVPGVIDEVDSVVDVNPEGTMYLAGGRRGTDRERVHVRYTNGVPELLFTTTRNFSLGGMSDDGQVVFGTLSGPGGTYVPSVWTAETGLVSLVDYLGIHGVTVPDSVDRFYWSYAISGDGQSFAGLCGLTGQELFPGFVATIPTPASLAAFMLGTLGVSARRRNR